MPNTDDAEAPVRAIADRLKAKRQSLDGRPESEVREELQATLEVSLRDLGEAEAEACLDRLRDHIIAEAKARDQRLAGLETELRRLRTENRDLGVARDEALRQSGRPRPEASSAVSGSTSSGGFEGLRGLLRRVAEGEAVQDEPAGLSRADARLYRLVSELLKFALNFERGVNDLVMRIQAGGGGDTRLWKHREKIILDRFRSCLDDREGSVQALRDALEKNSGFLTTLSKAFDSAMRRGVPDLLGELDPNGIAEKSPAAFGGTDFKKAWKMFSDTHADLINLPPPDMWERFFDQPFREKLGDYLQEGKPKA